MNGSHFGERSTVTAGFLVIDFFHCAGVEFLPCRFATKNSNSVPIETSFLIVPLCTAALLLG